MRTNTDWLGHSKWGVFTHYLSPDALTSDQWNKQVDGFDVQGLACQLESVGAPYICITLGQNSGHYCSPNAAYDSFVGIRPSKCSRRDLIDDLYEALAPRNIKLMVYLPSGAPDRDPVAMKGLEWKNGQFPIYAGLQDKGRDDRLVNFQLKWEAVITEWSKRWGKKVLGWWFDGCYFPKAMYEHPDRPNFKSFAAAAKAGNPESIVAFNPGVFTPVMNLTDVEDYTAGEIAEAFPVCPGPTVKTAQYHILSYLGNTWGSGPLRFPDEFVLGYTKHVVSKGGVVTWDVQITPGGLVPNEFLNQLKVLKKC